jgi:hypothetical protein
MALLGKSVVGISIGIVAHRRTPLKTVKIKSFIPWQSVSSNSSLLICLVAASGKQYQNTYQHCNYTTGAVF